MSRSCLSVNGEAMVYAAYKYKIQSQSRLYNTERIRLCTHKALTDLATHGHTMIAFLLEYSSTPALAVHVLPFSLLGT